MTTQQVRTDEDVPGLNGNSGESDDNEVTAEAALPRPGGLAAVSAAMRQLQALIDGYLDTPRPADPAPLTHPVAAEEPSGDDPMTTVEPGDEDDDGWGRAMAVRSRHDPQVGWIEANAALRRGEHARAFELFEAEATVAAEAEDHPRAAIAFRMASDAAAAMGRRDRSDHDLRLAGKHYLFVAEDPASSLQTMYSAYLAAARCFLAVGNLELTQSCVGRALALQEALNEDLHVRFNGPAQTPA